MRLSTKSRFLVDKHRTVCFAMTVLILLPGIGGAQRREQIFSLEDPSRDDHGAGDVIFPANRDLLPGELDLIEFSASTQGEDTLFRATFASTVRPVDSNVRRRLDTSAMASEARRQGFYTLNLDVYIDTDRTPDAGEVAMLPGRVAQVAATNAWEKAVILTPLPNQVRSAIRRSGALEGSADQLFFPSRVWVRGRSIEFLVPWDFLGGHAESGWSYAVVVTGALLQQRMATGVGSYPQEFFDGLVRPVISGTDQFAFRGGRPGGLQPALIDILLPPGSEPSQADVLEGFDADAGKMAQVPGVLGTSAQTTSEADSARR